MVKLRKRVTERFIGSQGKLWKSGDAGTATMFASWVRAFIRNNDPNNSTAKTSRESVSEDKGYEILTISFGREEIKPLDINVCVQENGPSVVSLRYRKDPRAAGWETEDFTIKDPYALSVDPKTGKLISVAFKGPQFSFAGNKGKLGNIPGYDQALSALEAPFKRAVEILKAYDKATYKSRKVQDFDALPQLQELKDKYSEWSVDKDVSKIASQNKVAYTFTHPSDPAYNFTVYFKDEGGKDYTIYATLNGDRGNLDWLAKELEHEVRRLEREADKYSEYDLNSVKKEMKVSGASSISLIDDPAKLDAFIKRIGDALNDFSLARFANIDITQHKDGTESWELILKTQHGTGSIFWTADPRMPVEVSRRTKDGGKETVVQDKIMATDFHTDFGYNTDVKQMGLISPEFFREIGKAAEKFLEEYGAYNRLLSSTTNIDSQIIGGKDWIMSYNKPDYNLANWADRVLGKIEPEIERLSSEYSMELERKVEVDTGSPEEELMSDGKPMRDISGKLVFTGSYVDKAFTDHLLEVRVNFDRGDKFVVWIRPDFKGTSNTKATGQSDLSFLKEWAAQNVAIRGAQKTSANYQQAIFQELINLGGREGGVKGTIDISTSKIKDITIDIKVTNDKIYAMAMRGGKIVDRFEIPGKPFAETPVKVAKDILGKIAKHIKESFPSVDRRAPEMHRYWDALFASLKNEGIQKQECYTSQFIQCGPKRCKASFSALGEVSLTSITGKEIATEQFNADPRYFKADAKHIAEWVRGNLNRF